MIMHVLASSLQAMSLLPGVAATTSVASQQPVAAAVRYQDQQTRRIRLVLAPAGNEARYRVREQLVGIDFPNDAVGKTSQITGALVFEPNGRIVREESKFVVNLNSIESDESRRDNFIRSRTLETSQYPNAEFVPAAATGLPATLPAAGDLEFKLTGDLTVHGVTRQATWDVKGRMASTGAFTGTAITAFKFGDFNMQVPRVRVVLSVVDSITLEFDVNLVPAGGG